MVIIPIINNNKIKQVKIELVDVYKTGKEINSNNIEESDIIIGSSSFKASRFNIKNQPLSSILEFIRTSYINNTSSTLISTKYYNSEHNYDLYQINPPLKSITSGLDNLYASIILDLKNRIPDAIKGKYIDLEKLNLTSHITDEKLELLQIIASNLQNNESKKDYQKMLQENGLEDLIETLKFMKLFYCEIIPSASIDIDNYKKVLESMNKVNTKEAKDLKKLYTMAKNNEKAYYKLSKLYNIVYNEPLHWIHSSKEKTKVKQTDEIRKIA